LIGHEERASLAINCH
jgi:hypothetical protein